MAFGKTVAQQTVTQERIAEARCKIDMARLLTLKAAWLMDVAGNKVAKNEIAMIKVVAPSVAIRPASSRCLGVDFMVLPFGEKKPDSSEMTIRLEASLRGPCIAAVSLR